MIHQSENSTSCDYDTPHEFKKIKIRGHDLSTLHLNIPSYHRDDLKSFLTLLDTKFDIICISIYTKITLNNISAKKERNGEARPPSHFFWTPPKQKQWSTPTINEQLKNDPPPKMKNKPPLKNKAPSKKYFLERNPKNGRLPLKENFNIYGNFQRNLL